MALIINGRAPVISDPPASDQDFRERIATIQCSSLPDAGLVHVDIDTEFMSVQLSECDEGTIVTLSRHGAARLINALLKADRQIAAAMRRELGA